VLETLCESTPDPQFEQTVSRSSTSCHGYLPAAS